MQKTLHCSVLLLLKYQKIPAIEIKQYLQLTRWGPLPESASNSLFPRQFLLTLYDSYCLRKPPTTVAEVSCLCRQLPGYAAWARNKAYIGDPFGHAHPPRSANRKGRHAICPVSCLVTCQRRRETNSGRKGRGGEGGRLVMNSSLQSYGNVQALGRACRDHVAHLVFVQQQSIKLLLRARLVPLCLCAESQWQQQQQQQIGGAARRAPAGSLLQWTLRHLFCPSITSEFFICTLTHREMQTPVHRRKRLHVRTPSFWWQTDKTNATTAVIIKQNAKQEDVRSV